MLIFSKKCKFKKNFSFLLQQSTHDSFEKEEIIIQGKLVIKNFCDRLDLLRN
jgi:hypothetical protein